MFAYCGNNPVYREDQSGFSWLDDIYSWLTGVAEDAWDSIKTVWKWHCTVNAKCCDFLGDICSELELDGPRSYNGVN